MKIAVCSDLHLEFGDIDLKNTENADVLILSGDITIADYMHDHPSPDNPNLLSSQIKLGRNQEKAYMFRDFFKRVSLEFPCAIYVAGNHEFYHGKWKASIDHLRDEIVNYPNINFLERDTVYIKGVTFIGGTLWTDCNKHDPWTLHALSNMMQDYRVIRNDELGYTTLKPATSAMRHRQTVDYLRHMRGENKNSPCVVVGHHAPSLQSISHYYAGQTLMNGGYASDLSELILDNPQIKLWTHGHVHEPSDYMIGDTRIVCNPRGYIGFEGCADAFKLKYVEI